jgi:hypothetical protein
MTMGLVARPLDAGARDASVRDASRPPILGSIAIPPGVVAAPPDAAIHEQDAGNDDGAS